MDYMEIEYKFWADISKEEFHSRVNSVVGQKTFPWYVVSCDDYYIKDYMEEGSFLRYRKGGGKSELTLKVKEDGNVVRKEINLNVTVNDESLVAQFIDLSGYEKVRSIFKEAWVFETKDCDLSYYTLPDGRSVIELEAINYSDIKQGVQIIDDWAMKLKLNMDTQETRSLFEIYNQMEDDKLPKQLDLFNGEAK